VTHGWLGLRNLDGQAAVRTWARHERRVNQP
jgi:hypothetical protein